MEKAAIEEAAAGEKIHGAGGAVIQAKYSGETVSLKIDVEGTAGDLHGHHTRFGAVKGLGTGEGEADHAQTTVDAPAAIFGAKQAIIKIADGDISIGSGFGVTEGNLFLFAKAI